MLCTSWMCCSRFCEVCSSFSLGSEEFGALHAKCSDKNVSYVQSDVLRRLSWSECLISSFDSNLFLIIALIN